MEISINAYLKSERTELKPIIFKVSFGFKTTNALSGKVTYRPLFYNSEIKVREEEWDKSQNLPKSRSDISELLRLEDVIKHTYDHLVLKKIKVTPERLKKELDTVLGRSHDNGVDIIILSEYIETIFEVDERRSKNTRAQYKNLKNHLVKFEEKKKMQFTNENFDRKLYVEFMDYIKGLLNTANSVWKIQKNLKAVLNDIRRNYVELSVFDPMKELSKSEKTKLVTDDSIYFSFEQIEKIIEYEPKTDKYKNVKLILLTLLFTGCRYGDVFKINKQLSLSIEGGEIDCARFITDKGKGVEVIVPILAPLRAAIEDNNGPARQISQVKFNEYVKDLAKSAKFKEEITLAYTNSEGEKEFKTRPIYELVTSHIGRRSFITNLINYIPITILCKITGHALKDKSIIFKYNKITLEENARLFIEELKRVCESRPKNFPIKLI